MNELVILFYILWYIIAFLAVKHEQRLREIYEMAKEMTDSLFEKEEEENE